LEYLLDHGAPAVRDAAMIATLAWSSPHGWAACETAALDRTKDNGLAKAIYAALGQRSHHQRLVERLSDESARASTLFALGFSGNAGLLPVLLEHLKGPDGEAKVAAEAIATITGLDLLSDAYALPPPPPPEGGELPPVEEDEEALASLPPVEMDDLDGDITPKAEDALPRPNVHAIELFCRDSAGRFDTARRLLGGIPYSTEVLIDYLETAPMRRRHVLALAFGIRTGGAVWLDTRGFATAQRAEIGALRARGVRGLGRAFMEF
jgi:uncharacterized protein (TIGR02270 family)